jgi:hypothetical protein
MSKHEKSEPDQDKPVFSEIFDTDDPDLIYINPNVTKEDIDVAGDFLSRVASRKTQEDELEQAQRNQEEMENEEEQ